MGGTTSITAHGPTMSSEDIASKPDPYGTNTAWDPNDAAKVRAWSGSFGAGPMPVERATPLERYKLNSSGRSFAEIHALCEEARNHSKRRPVSAPVKRQLPEARYNDPGAFEYAMPGYCGFRPRVRRPVEKAVHALNLASTNSRAYVTPAKMPAFKTFGRSTWSLSEYRKVCHTNIGKGSPYVKDLDDPARSEKTFTTMIRHGEYFVECQPTVPKRHNFT